MKLNLNNRMSLLFNLEEGVKIRGIYDLFRYHAGEKTEDVIGTSFRILVDSEIFPDLDYVYVKIIDVFKEDFQYLDLNARYIPHFENLTGNIYQAKDKGISMSLKADSVSFEEV